MNFSCLLFFTIFLCAEFRPLEPPSRMEVVKGYYDQVYKYSRQKMDKVIEYFKCLKSHVESKMKDVRERGQTKFDDQDVPDMSKEQFEEMLKQLTEKLQQSIGIEDNKKEENVEEDSEEKPL